MGEPLHNADEVLRACDILLDEKGLGFSRNKVTVSTSGLVPQMERFLRESEASLAVSLNATTDYIQLDHAHQSNIIWRRCSGCFGANSPGSSSGDTRDRCFSSTSCSRASTTATRTRIVSSRSPRDVPCKINPIHFNTHEGSEFKCSDQERIKALGSASATPA